MLNIRTIVLSVVLTLALAVMVYAVAVPSQAMAAESTSETCVAASAPSLSNQALRDILDGRYEHRVGLPR